MATDSPDTHPKFILALERRYHTKAGKGRIEVTYFHEGKSPVERTDALNPWIVEEAPKWAPEEGKWTNLLRWYARTKDLPGAREAYDAEVSQEPEKP